MVSMVLFGTMVVRLQNIFVWPYLKAIYKVKSLINTFLFTLTNLSLTV